MGSVRPFKHYIGKEVKKREKEPQTARALRKDVDERIQVAEQIPIRFRLEFIYDTIRAEIEARLAEDGFKAYSHNAAISYVKKDLSEEEIFYCNKLRELRNEARYYGKIIREEETITATLRMKKLIQKIRKNS